MNSSEFSTILKQAEALLSTETDPIANAANIASLIYHSVERLNWAGFYFYKGSELVLGPFSGQVACTRIAVGNGVCGTSYSSNQTLIVDDVHQFDGHIACDAASESEIVVPFQTEVLSGVLDIDSPHKARFGNAEKEFFESIVEIYTSRLRV